MGVSPKYLGLGGVMLLLGTGAGWVGHAYISSGQNPTVLRSERLLPAAIPASQEAIAQAAPSSSLPIDSNFIATAANRVGPSVVRIDASRAVTGSADSGERRLFKRFFGEDCTAVARAA